MTIEEDLDMGYDIPPQVPDDLIDLNEAEKKIVDAQESLEAMSQEYYYADLLEKNPQDKGLLSYGMLKGYLRTTTAMETFSIEAAVDAAGTVVKDATDGLFAALKEKLGGWISKIGPTLSATGKAITEFITKQWDKVAGLVTRIGGSIKTTVVAHPFATLLGTVGACVGLGAVAPALMRFAPGVLAAGGRVQVASAAESATVASREASTVAGRMNTIVSKLASPFKKFSFKATEGNISLQAVAGSTPVKAVSGDAAKLGWTKQSIAALMGKLGQVKEFAPKLSKMAADLYHAEVSEISALWKSKRHLKLAGSLGWKSFLYLPFIKLGWEIIKAVFHLIKTVIWGTFSMVTKTFKALTGQGSDTTKTPIEGEANA